MALIGKVPVKVTTANGPIAPGDLLTSSARPGVAMKATAPGPTIGMALEPFAGPLDEVGTILCFMSVGEGNVREAARELQLEQAVLKPISGPTVDGQTLWRFERQAVLAVAGPTGVAAAGR